MPPIMKTSISEPADPAALALWVKRASQAAGFGACGIVDLVADDAAPRREALEAFLAAGYHGDMAWMAEAPDRRTDPRVLWSEARTAILFGYSYAPKADPLDALGQPHRGVISVYAQGRDYHDIIKGKLKGLAGAFAAKSGADVKVFVDTAPLMEKPLAQAAGLGWGGKHTVLVSRAHGSWLFLGAILTTTPLPPDRPHKDHCGTCRRCLDICPTDAFPAPYRLDPRRCIAYLTIEHKGPIRRDLRRAMGNRVFGCDDCLAVCPWNRFARATSEIRFHARAETDNPPLAELLALDDAAFRARFAGTPIKRTGRDRFVRNCLIAAGNAADPALDDGIVALVADGSALVRGAAVWALAERFEVARFAALAARYQPQEADETVLAEWALALRDVSARRAAQEAL